MSTPSTPETKPTFEPIALRSHLAFALFAMSLVVALGTWLAWHRARSCAGCPLPPVGQMLTVLGLTGAASLFLGSMILWAPLTRRNDAGS